MNKVNIFISYSHKDEAHKEKLESHLHSLKRDDKINQWNDRKITAGDIWKNKIDSNLSNSDIILLLISSDFISSEYCYEKELSTALKRHEEGETIVIPVILRHSKWHNLSFSSIQALPKDGYPITAWNDEDEAWLNVIDGISGKVDDILSKRSRSKEQIGFVNFNQLLKNELDSMDSVFTNLSYRGFSTGISDLDEITNGLSQEAFIAIGGRPDMGHSLLALQTISNLSINKKTPCAIFSLNHSSAKIMTPLLGLYSEIPEYKLATGNLDEMDWPKLSRGVNLMKDSPLYIDDSVATNISKIEEKCKELKNREGLEVVLIDGLQRLVFNENRSDATKTIKDITSELNLIARELKITIVATFNIEKYIEQRPNKRPMIEDLDQYSSLRENADQIFLLYRDEVYNPHPPQMGITEVIIIRNVLTGKIGTVELKLNKELNRFENLLAHN